jgi:hypothetical protein
MSFNAQQLLANLAEKERVKGHHSPEGQAIRIISRALHGWSLGTLAAGDVVLLCRQALEDWLKARMQISEWSSAGLAELIAAAARTGVLTDAEAEKLRLVHERQQRLSGAAIDEADVLDVIRNAIVVLEARWR